MWRCSAGGSAHWPTSSKKTTWPPSASCPNATLNWNVTSPTSPSSASRPLQRDEQLLDIEAQDLLRCVGQGQMDFGKGVGPDCPNGRQHTLLVGLGDALI